MSFVIALLFAAQAGAAAIPGATYTAQADGGLIQFTVSSNGTMVSSYVVDDAQGRTPSGGSCRFIGDEQPPAWNGVPITNNAFSYQVTNTILFKGVFDGAQSAHGTFDFDSPSVGDALGCNTGLVTWTATTTATPPPGNPGGRGSNSVKIAATARVNAKGIGAFKLSDSGAASDGKVTLTVTVKKRVKVNGKPKVKTVSKLTTVAAFSYSLAGGSSLTYDARLSAAGRRLLDAARGRKLKVTATIAASPDPSSSATVTLIGAKPAARPARAGAG